MEGKKLVHFDDCEVGMFFGIDQVGDNLEFLSKERKSRKNNYW